MVQPTTGETRRSTCVRFEHRRLHSKLHQHHCSPRTTRRRCRTAARRRTHHLCTAAVRELHLRFRVEGRVQAGHGGRPLCPRFQLLDADDLRRK